MRTPRLTKDRLSVLSDDTYSLSGRSDRTLASQRSVQTLLPASQERRELCRAGSHHTLNTPSAWEAMGKMADARLAVSNAEQERMKNWRLRQLAGKCYRLERMKA